MQGVTFGTKHSYYDFGLYLKSRPVISPPKPKTNIIDIPGADGHLDLSTALTGRVLYEMRKIRMEFVVINGRERWADVYSELLNYMHGQVMQIILDNDPFYYYEGRIVVNEWKSGKKTGTVIVEATVNPFKTEINKRPCLENLQITSSGTTINIRNCGTRKTRPVFTLHSGYTTVTLNGNVVVLQSGSHVYGNLVFNGDLCAVYMEGDGVVSIEFHGGYL